MALTYGNTQEMNQTWPRGGWVREGFLEDMAFNLCPKAQELSWVKRMYKGSGIEGRKRERIGMVNTGHCSSEPLSMSGEFPI